MLKIAPNVKKPPFPPYMPHALIIATATANGANRSLRTSYLVFPTHLTGNSNTVGTPLYHRWSAQIPLLECPDNRPTAPIMCRKILHITQDPDSLIVAHAHMWHAYVHTKSL